MGLKPIPSTHEKLQQPKSKSKGKEHETNPNHLTNPEEQLNIRLMDKLIKKPTGKKPQEAPDPADMDVKDAHTQAPSQ